MRNMRIVGCLIAACVLLAGCNSPSMQSRESLNAGYQALEQKQYDQAIAKADDFLRQHPHGPGAAEALYLRGRAFEERLSPNEHDAAMNLQTARNSYLQALSLTPPKGLEAYIRTSLANVAFFQDDYVTALDQWNGACDQIAEKDLKSRVLLRIGITQQRLGQFEKADQTFAKVLQSYPETLEAQRAREKQGARQFFVQLATFKSAASAEKLIADLKKQGMTPYRATDSQGRHLVSVGPAKTYDQAKVLKQKFAGPYPDALIIP
jgi:tetratricopeptide (TPR) repeat protein